MNMRVHVDFLDGVKILHRVRSIATDFLRNRREGSKQHERQYADQGQESSMHMMSRPD
jgi:hypothetical protein